MSSVTRRRRRADARAICQKAFNDFALVERPEIAKLNATLQTDLESRGMVFNKTEPDSFRDALRKAGFYAAMLPLARRGSPEPALALLDSGTRF
jgi:TRAP-type transport system periplasmic protein